MFRIFFSYFKQDEKEKNEALKATKEPPPDAQAPTEDSDQGEPQQQNADSEQPPQNPFVTPFGQFPFRMPFMPPFPHQQSQNGPFPMQQNQTGSTNLAQVPRFPLPFVSPFLPPPPQMMQFGNGPLHPAMVPPWPPSTVGMGTRPPFIPPNAGESTVNGSRDTNNVQASASASSQEEGTNVVGQSSSVNDTSQGQEIPEAAQASPSSEQADSNEDPSLRSQTTGVRRRLAASVLPEERINRETSSSQARSAHIPERARESESPIYWLFVSVIVIAILLLILRRLYVLKLLPVLF